MVLLCEVSNAIYAQDMEFSRLAGTLVGIGMSRGKPLSITAAASGTLVQKELQIVGSILDNRQDAIDLLDFSARGIISIYYKLRTMSKLTAVYCPPG